MKLFGLILTYNCENLIEKTIDMIPKKMFSEIICSDDGSIDRTKEKVESSKIKFFTHKHLGYGGNLFFGLTKAFELGATHVIEIHGDGQYNLKNIDKIIGSFVLAKSDLILGNRFYNYSNTLKNGMPFHIFVGNIFLSFIARTGINLKIDDCFPGQRAYSKKFFDKIRKHNLPDGYEFSFEIIMLSKLYNLNISSVNCECNYIGERKTAPLHYLFKCLFHLIKTIYFYNFKKDLLKLN